MDTRSLMPANDQQRLRRAIRIALLLVAAIWAIWALDAWFDLRLHVLGIYPGRAASLPAIVSAPLIHGSLEHVTANTLPLLVMLSMLLYAYPRSAWPALVVIWLGSGLIVWFIGRPAWHYGASGLTHGLMFFLFIVGALRRDRLAMAFAMVVFFLYGSMVWGIFPREPGISFEYHLAGAGLGVLLAVLLRHRDPRPAEKRYDWEGEDEAGADEDAWGDDDPGPPSGRLH